MKKSYLFYALVFFCISCQKSADALIERTIGSTANTVQFTSYKIRQGQHSADHNFYKAVETNEFKFVVKFDSSAIYQTNAPVNQYDINKLYGFSDNHAGHHQYSARFGWNWNHEALHLFAYVYNMGNLIKEEVGTIPIGAEISCSIKISDSSYVFTAHDTSLSLPRLSTTPTAKGYMLYPYFGGDEVAPHDITIQIKN